MTTLAERLNLDYVDFAVIANSLHLYKQSIEKDLNSLHRVLGDDYKGDPVANYGEDKLHLAESLYDKIYAELYGKPVIDDSLADCENCSKTIPRDKLSVHNLCPSCVRGWIK